MADVEVKIKVQADVNALTAIKKELKEMKALALNGDGAAAKRVAELTDKLEDLKDTTKSLKGDGVERLQSSFSLLNDSLRTGDLDKFKTGLKGVGSAMSAIPLLFLIEGMKALFDNFDKVVEVAKVFFGAFSEGEQGVKRLNKELEKQKEINKGLVAGLEDEIKILEAQGASSAKILQKKKELNAIKIKELEIDAHLQIARIQEIKDNDTLTEAYYRKSAAVLSSLGFEEKAAAILKMIDHDKAERAKEAVAKVKEDIVNIQHLKTEDRVNEIKEEKEQAKKKKEIVREVAADNRKEDKEHREFLANLAKEEEKQKQQSEKDANDLFKQLSDEQDKSDKKAHDDKIQREKEFTALKKQESDTRYNIERQGVQAAQIFSDIFFQEKIAAAQGDEAKQLSIKKKAFEVNKAFQAAQAGIDGTRATLSAFATAPPGFKIAAAAAAGIFAAAQVAKILSAKFNAGAAATPTSNISTGGDGGAPLGGQITPQGNSRGQDSTTFDANGRQSGGVTWVSVVDINSAQKGLTKISDQARF